MFKNVSTKVAKTMGSDRYIASPSISSTSYLSPLALVEKRPSTWHFWKDTYRTTDFSLKDIVADRTLEVRIITFYFNFEVLKKRKFSAVA